MFWLWAITAPCATTTLAFRPRPRRKRADRHNRTRGDRLTLVVQLQDLPPVRGGRWALQSFRFGARGYLSGCVHYLLFVDQEAAGLIEGDVSLR